METSTLLPLYILHPSLQEYLEIVTELTTDHSSIVKLVIEILFRLVYNDGH